MIVARRRTIVLNDPVFTFSGGDLQVITYAGGWTKTFGYDGSQRVSTIDLLYHGITRRKTFTYNGGGDLESVIETILP